MSSFKKNRPIPIVTSNGKEIINKAEDVLDNSKKHKITKEITIPFTAEMSGLLEAIFEHFGGDISRRKLCSKYLLRALKEEYTKLT